MTNQRLKDLTALANSLLDKRDARREEKKWEEASARQEKIALAKASHKLISSQEVREMWLSLEPGQCLVLSADGSIHKGSQSHVRKDKMNKLKEEFRTEEKSSLFAESDMKSAMELYPMPITGRKSNWDTRVRLAPGSKGAVKRGRPEISTSHIPADDI